ncbi:unnamed protein product [Prorocentrum cordatum]|uniref:J domain-containing protein n=1 Tax=Prorocentrum cordatum TaxID=2364126 RepID=A0ABN9Y777_9DINO|nr:unnamed protein product [Polarella glacialis]
MLSCIVVPWGLTVLWNLLFPGRGDVAQVYPEEDGRGRRVRNCQTQAMNSRREAHKQELRSRRRMFTKGFVFRLVILLLLAAWLAYTVYQVRAVMATSKLYQNFDPHEILGIGRSDKASAIKKSFHKLSLKYHPDKNTQPGAAEKFMLIKKAYDALTDPVARRNYERYGNPDGPTRMEVGVALPTFGKENQGAVLALFVVFFIVGVPLALLSCMGSGSGEVLPNGVLRATMEMLAEKITPTMDVRAAQELLLASGESALCPERPGEAELLEEGFAEALAAAVELHRCVLQALEPGKEAGHLLQVPHFNAERSKAWKKGPRRAGGLPAFLQLPAEERAAGLREAGLGPQELADASEFATVAPRVSIAAAKVFVDGEDGVCEGDIATLSVTLRRANLQAEEAAGAAHTPLFPSATVPEAWWLVFTMPDGKKGKASRCQRLTSRAHEVVGEMKFRVAALGKTRCKVSVLCESYAGLDLEQDLVFEATKGEQRAAADGDGSDGEDAASEGSD